MNTTHRLRRNERVRHLHTGELATVLAVEGDHRDLLRVAVDGLAGDEVWHSSNVRRAER